ncbi:MAG: hypothetical protein AUG49_11350 [Catenulispora sp. 13_1_20CM_3_70_7]|nr:MAG: hypothetical protein AUG49_11350 [Catenulispora sp. 13_1_20CM_3_70_7]
MRADEGTDRGRAGSIAIVGMACRYPEADDPSRLWDLVMEQRRAFRRMPPERLAVQDYLDITRTAPDGIYSTRAALLEGWSFDRAAFRVPGRVHRAADPAHWLSLETADRALRDAGLPGGRGVDRDRVAVVIGNSLTGEVTRARTLRLRWPFVRRVLAEALAEEGITGRLRDAVVERAAGLYAEPFPAGDDETLAGGLANTIAGRICNHFDFHGGGYTVDGACASSLLAVITACGQLREGGADLALAGGVDISLDPFELVGFARLGALAQTRMRVYDEQPTGFLPGEGCGMVALMRAEDASAMGVPAYAEIRGWGVSSDGGGSITRPEVDGQLLALRRAYEAAGIEPDEVGLFEGHGTGTAVGDAVELAALSELLRDTRRAAALGTVKANIGHTKAAAGLAGMIKAGWSVAEGVLPPTTGCEHPRPELVGPQARLRVLDAPEPWPSGPRIAGISAMGFGGINTHIVLAEPTVAGARRVAAGRVVVPLGPARSTAVTEVFLLSAATAEELAGRLARLSDRVALLTDAEFGDLACQWGRQEHRGPVRVALTAESAEELAERMRQAVDVLDGLAPGALVIQRGVHIGHLVDGRITLLMPGQGAPVRRGLGTVGADLGTDAGSEPIEDADTAAAQSAIHRATLAGLRWLSRLGVDAHAAIGHSLGEFAALVWSGGLTEAESLALVDARGRLMAETAAPGTGMLSLAVEASTVERLCAGTGAVIAGYNGPRSHVVAASAAEIDGLTARAADHGVQTVRLAVAHGFHSPAVQQAGARFGKELTSTRIRQGRPGLLSTVTGDFVPADADLTALLARQMTEPVRFWDAVSAAAADTDLFCEIGPGRTLAPLAAETGVPVVSLDVGAADCRARAGTVAALHACGVLTLPATLFAGRRARPVDLWRERVFIANPCGVPPTGQNRMPDTTAFDQAAGLLGGPAPTQESRPLAIGAADGDLLTMVTALVAQTTELDPAAITPDQRLLSDLHLSSLTVARLVAQAARLARREPPAVPLSLADATVGEVAEVLQGLPPASGQDADAPVAGAAPWIRTFVEHLEPVSVPATCVIPARVSAAGESELADIFSALFPDTASEGPELLYLPDDEAEARPQVLWHTARRALPDRGLVVVTHGSGLSGFLGSLHQEFPELGLTLLRVPASEAGIRAAAWYASAEPGRLRELVMTEDGVIHRPRMLPANSCASPEDDSLLGPGDVVLVTGGAKGIGHECAAALARRAGSRLGLLGRARPESDPVLRRHLDALIAAGLTVSYAQADLADPAAVGRAVRELESALGPVTAVVHAAGVNEPAAFDAIDEAELERHLAPKVRGLDAVLAAVPPRRLKVLIAFGSVIGRYGLPGECHYGLANGLLRQRAEKLAEESPSCRVRVVDWSVWSGAGMGERLGVLDELTRRDVTAIPVHDGVSAFLDLIDAADLPVSVAVHGRMGFDAEPLDVSGAVAANRGFLEHIRIHYPGMELVAECAVDAREALLAEHRIDGVPVLPAVVGLEAMAQAASALVGAPLRCARDVRLDSPVVVAPDAPCRLRVCAVVDGDAVVVALRSDLTDFRVDHFRAVFPLTASPPDDAVAGIVADEPTLAGAGLYGTLYFHEGRFRRVRALYGLHARSVRIVVEGDDPDPAGRGALLGDAAVNDTTIHALQACVPHRRLLPIGCREFWSAARTPDSTALTVHARERHADGGVFVWDADAVDESGRRVLSWRGLRLKEVADLPVSPRWTAELFAVHLERGALGLGLDQSLAVAVNASDTPRSRPPRRPETGTSRSHCGSLTLTVSGNGPVAADWQHVPDGEAVPISSRPDRSSTQPPS